MDNVEAKRKEWDTAFKAITLPGPWAEFGTATGRTLSKFILPNANLRLPPPEIYAFDSWLGLPEHWDRGETMKPLRKGHFACDVPVHLTQGKVSYKKLVFVKGWFHQTTPHYAEGEPWAFMHMDADLYSSTIEVLTVMNKRIVPGTVIRFDEYQGYPNAAEHEEKAFMEWTYEYSRTAKLIAESKCGATWIVES